MTADTWTCASCGEVHEGLPLDWSLDAPAYWDGARHDDDWLGSDLCIWRDDGGDPAYFVRGVLEIPVVDLGETFRYGVWSSLSERSFTRMVDLWDDPRRIDEPPYFGWLSNSLPGYAEPTLNLPAYVVVRALELRPSIELHDGDHPLIREQRDGITVARVREIAEQNLHHA